MDYSEAILETFTHVQVKREIEKHNLEYSNFVNDCFGGVEKTEYKGSVVLNWLGY